MFSFGFNAFMGFNVQSSAVVQDLLSRTDLKLEDLLDEEAVIYEVKTQNQKLLDFLLDPENFKSLIKYIITEPEIDDFDFDQKRMFKYPFVCADLLSAESNPIVDEFFKSKHELEEAERAEAQREKEIEKQIEEAEKTEDQSESNVILDKEKALEDNAEVIIEKDEPSRQDSQQNDMSRSVESREMNEEEVDKIKKDNTDLVYLNQLFGILEEKEVNLTCAGYFAKVATAIFSKKPAQFLAFIFKQRPELLDKMINHIASKSIAEFLGKILTFESSLLDDVHNQVYNEERVRALKLILQKLEPSSDVEGINNSAYLICEVFGKYNVMHGTQEVLGKLLESSVIENLYRILNLRDSIPSCATALVLGNIFAYYILINTKIPEHNPEETPNLEVPHAHPHLQHTELSSQIPLIAAFLENIKSIIEYIATPASSEEIETQFGSKIIPFGAAKLKFLELLIISMKANNKDIYNKLVEHGFFESLLDLIVRYEWNNMLHSQIEKIITFVIDGNNEDLKLALLEKAGLLDFIIRVYAEDEIPLKGKHERKVRRGYLGHVVKISNRVLENSDPLVQKHAQNHAGWAEYTKTKLADINTKDKLHLGGKDPRVIPETLANAQGSLELPSIMEKFSKFFNIQAKPEPKNLEDEVIDGDDITGEKEQNILTEGIPKDEMILREEEQGLKPEPPLNTAPENPDSPDIAPRGRASFGMKNNRRVGGTDKDDDEDNEDDGPTLWFSDPAANANKTEEQKTENVETAEKKETTTETSGQQQKKESNDIIEGEGYPTQFIKQEESHTAEDILKEQERSD